jgi:acetyl esterase/lipase
MHTLRLSLVGTVILALLGGLSGAVVAQSEQPGMTGLWPKLEGYIEYGKDDPVRQVIHVLRLEPREAPRPAVIFFHGGGLVLGEPLQDLDSARWVADQGYVTFMAGYRLFDKTSGRNPWPTQLQDAQRAVRWIRAHSDEFNIDPDRVCATGHSSGGHLAGLVGTSEVVEGSDPELAGIPSRVDCVVSISGDADLTVPYQNPYWTDVFEEMFGATLAEDPAAWRAASPAHNVDEETPPFLVIHGNRDEEVPIQMARNLADALAVAGREFVFAEVPAGHLDIGAPEATMALIKAFLAYQLHPER